MAIEYLLPDKNYLLSQLDAQIAPKLADGGGYGSYGMPGHTLNKLREYR
jgi:hypothetical protein